MPRRRGTACCWRAASAALLQVKTLGPSKPNEYYARTRAFYESMGFVPLEEFENIWPGNPCLILVNQVSPEDR
jgi:hypothetical protein